LAFKALKIIKIADAEQMITLSRQTLISMALRSPRTMKAAFRHRVDLPFATGRLRHPQLTVFGPPRVPIVLITLPAAIHRMNSQVALPICPSIDGLHALKGIEKNIIYHLVVDRSAPEKPLLDDFGHCATVNNTRVFAITTFLPISH
jgi:hypothetical protein